ncbi:hypothetical protein J1N35_041608 [Gossypium stocksii]|uniref:Uncharacterized protein n=1 Tax=Gossypium stocksii TaxID=47602 RepID=A0A9D3ZIU0_9ROSI|nr:hypothetical protein J1N35_041608 [Gossypium stocksii]
MAIDLNKVQQEMVIFWGYVRRMDKAIKKSLQKNFTHPMPTFPIFPKELLLEPEEDNGKGEESTTEKQTIEQEREAEKTESIHVESEKEDEDVTQATAPTDTITTTQRLKAPMVVQECAVHHLIDGLTKSDSDYKEEVPINQLKKKRYKTITGKVVPVDSGEIERQMHYKLQPRSLPKPN